MGTRGAVGFFHKGVTKASYNHYDSYPSGLGIDVLDWARKQDDLSSLAEKVDNIKMVSEDKKPSKELLEKARELGLINLDVSTQSEKDTYCVLRNAQGDLGAYIDVGYMIDGEPFLSDSLFCEWAYIVNLDTEELEVYKGFQTKKGKGRYVGTTPEPTSWGSPGYWGVSLIKTYPLSSLPGHDTFIDDCDLVEEEVA
jgi:hypothetical protein